MLNTSDTSITTPSTPAISGRIMADPILKWKYVVPLSFVLVAALLVITNAFPALYGDEYGSLYESDHLATNLHAIGYLAQLWLWKSVSDSDLFLRLLSLLWMAAGLYWLKRWLESEPLAANTRNLVLLLAVTNPFLWVYGVQVRFYAFFFATSILFIWRFREWQKEPTRRNLGLMALGAALMCTAHLFGFLVLGIALLSWLWGKLERRRWYLGIGLALVSGALLIPPVRYPLVAIVYRFSNPYAQAPPAEARGLSVAMLAKVPLTGYFFSLGERVYPLWWWVTLPALAVVAAAFLLGLWQLRRYGSLSAFVAFILLSVPALYLILDPLAPPGLQGAAPRYVIFVLPVFLLTLALGAVKWRPLVPAIILAQLVGLFYLLWPSWSYSGSDLMDWPRYLSQAAPQPNQTCIVVDGRGRDSVQRYAPPGSKITSTADDCLGYERVLLVSNDYRLDMVRPMDALADKLQADYGLVSNMTLFPAQITVYAKSQGGLTQPPPGRLGLLEQDLRLPLQTPQTGRQINGFVRLDSVIPRVSVPLKLDVSNTGNVLVVTSYSTERTLPEGTPVLSLTFHIASAADKEIVLRSGKETAALDGSCAGCSVVGSWTKLSHLVGAQNYPGAYRQYQARLWGAQAQGLAGRITSVELSSLLDEGTVYFWGAYNYVQK